MKNFGKSFFIFFPCILKLISNMEVILLDSNFYAFW